MMHNSPIYEEFQTPSAKILTLPRKQDHLDNSNDISKPDIPTISQNILGVIQVGLPPLWIKSLDKPFKPTVSKEGPILCFV